MSVPAKKILLHREGLLPGRGNAIVEIMISLPRIPPFTATSPRPFCRPRECDTMAPATFTPTEAALAAVAAERRRQIDIEGWSAKHDDQHVNGELAVAAACYALEAALPDDERDFHNPPPDFWPWEREWWKPSFRVRGLVKACAMLIGEIERLERKAARVSR